MQEVTIRLRFNRVCLGAAKRKKGRDVVYCMDRDAKQQVMFMPSAWLGVMRYAAKLANRHQALVKRIDWNPVVTGVPRPDWRRTIISDAAVPKRTHYAVHEAFPPGSEIEVSAVLPDGMTIDDFWKLLEIVGTYKGFSPFNNDSEQYGTFEIIRITPAASRWTSPEPEAANSYEIN